MEIILFLFSLVVGWWPYRKIRSAAPSRTSSPFHWYENGTHPLEICLWIPIAGWIPLMVRRQNSWLIHWRVVGFGDVPFQGTPDAELRPWLSKSDQQ